MKVKRILQFLSNSLAGLLFTAAFFILFASTFAASLLENLPVLESSMQKQFGSDFVVEQIAKESGLTKEEIIRICSGNPVQEGCDQINNPEKFSSQAIEKIEKQISPYKSIMDKLKPVMFLLFILSLVFYFFGTMSVYGSCFKLSVNALTSTLLGYIALASLSGALPGIIDQGFEIASQDLPAGISSLKEEIAVIMIEWLEEPIEELRSLFLYILIFSLLSSIIFYFLKKKLDKSNKKSP